MKTILITLSAFVALVGMAGTAQADAYQIPSAKKAAKNPNGFTRIINKKGGAGINLSYKIVGTPAAGKALTVVVMASGAENGQITLTADNGLALQDPSQVLTIEAGKPSQHSIVVTPQADGRYYLNLFSQVGDKNSASSVAVQVGSSQTNQKSSSGGTTQTIDGQRLKTIQVQ